MANEKHLTRKVSFRKLSTELSKVPESDALRIEDLRAVNENSITGDDLVIYRVAACFLCDLRLHGWEAVAQAG